LIVIFLSVVASGPRTALIFNATTKVPAGKAVAGGIENLHRAELDAPDRRRALQRRNLHAIVDSLHSVLMTLRERTASLRIAVAILRRNM
jgi:hypothetical protein